jgi:predicted 3-demethylubiquinone-9 3-methyltransferase (glyoxalase superfamily)
MQKISTFLWFEDQAEQAAKFYVSIFARSKITTVARYGAAGPGKPGSVMTVAFKINGQSFIALNGGPHYKITPAISFVITCATQKEIDGYWRKLTKGGKEVQCGWLEDKFGVSWQVVPKNMPKLLRNDTAMKAMMGMIKLDIAKLEHAAKEGDAAKKKK